MKPKSQNITAHHGEVSRPDREALLGQKGAVLWFTGYSGSGKSTLARAVEQRLHAAGRLVYVLDGDNVRQGLCANLGFSADDRQENIRRIGEVAALFVDAGAIVLTAFISPYQRDRDQARACVQTDDFIEVFVDTPLDVCESRDPKGLYKKARAGEIPEFTGISAPYEPPVKPELRVPTAEMGLDECAAMVEKFLAELGLLQAPIKEDS